MLNKKVPEDNDSRMLKEILNGTPHLSEMLVDTSIRHAINSATLQFNNLVSDQNILKEHIEEYGYDLVDLLRKKVNGQFNAEDLSSVDSIRSRLNNLEKKVDINLRPKTLFSFREGPDFNIIKLVFIKLNYVIEMILCDELRPYE